MLSSTSIYNTQFICFSVHTILCNYDPNLMLAHFMTPEKKCTSFSNHSHVPLQLLTIAIYFLSVKLPMFNISCKGNQVIYFVSCLSLSRFSKSIHVALHSFSLLNSVTLCEFDIFIWVHPIFSSYDFYVDVITYLFCVSIKD
jgi:hypothetical protein